MPNYNMSAVTNNSNVLTYNSVGKYNSYSYLHDNAKIKNNYSDLLSYYGKNSTASSKETQNYLAGIKNYSHELLKISDKMRSTIPPVFSAMDAASEKPEAITAKVDGTVADKSGTNIDVEVKQLATKQSNEGQVQTASNKNAANAGNNGFSIEIGGKSHAFNVNISNDDTNQKAQTKIADAINKKNIGVKATVQFDSKTNKSTLLLESKNTGLSNKFNIQDTDDGNLVKNFGLSSVKQDAQDAVYSVNNEKDLTSASNNDVYIGKGITATLKETTKDKVGITTKKDVDSISSNINEVIKNFNSLLEKSKDLKNDKGAQNLTRQLSGTVVSSQYSLSNIGITKDNNGFLQVDSDKLKKSITNGSAEKVLGTTASNSSSSFIGKLNQISKQVDSNPNAYLKGTPSNAKGTDSSSFQRFINQWSTGTGMLYSSMI